MENSKDLDRYLTETNQSNSNLDKQFILEKYNTSEYVKKVLYYTYHPLLQFGVTSKNVLKFSGKSTTPSPSPPTDMSLFNLLDSLASRSITGNAALFAVLNFSTIEPHIFKIVDKNLKTRVNTASINKVFPNLIPTFEPVLSNEYRPAKTTLDSNWYISRKLDGVRCLVHVANGTVTPRSRNGKELYNLENIMQAIKQSYTGPNVFLDGELVSLKNDTENFADAISIVRSSKKSTDNTNLVYKVFDIIPEDDFLSGHGTAIFSDRQKKLLDWKTKLQGTTIQTVKQVRYSVNAFESMTQAVSDRSWEGLMVRNNVPYKGKRNNGLLKVKKFHDAEFKVTDIVSGDIRMINDETGLEETVKCLSSVVFFNKKVQVKVGSGFTMEQRRDFHVNSEKILNKSITVKYFEETPDGSLRFPIFIGIRDYE